MYSLLIACFRTALRTYLTLFAIVIELFLAFRLHGGLFYLLAVIGVAGSVGVLLSSWRLGGSEQKQHDAAMGRLPTVDSCAKEWIEDPAQYEFIPMPDFPESFFGDLQGRQENSSSGKTSE